MDIKAFVRWRATFFNENFNVDQCLTEITQKTDLESLRNELKEYAIDLHMQMSEILKTETETIVNLAEYLTNLNSKIDDLSSPVSQLREEIKTLHDLVKEAKEDFEKMLTAIKANSVEKDNLSMKREIISCCIYVNRLMNNNPSDDLMLLERAVNAFSFQKNYLLEWGLLTPDLTSNIKDIEARLVNKVNAAFLISFRNNDVMVITKCLHMYDNLRMSTEAESIFQVNIVRPELQKIICESNLARYDQNIDGVYAEVSNFMTINMSKLLSVLRSNPELKSFNFILRSFWSEVDKQCKEGLPYITAPGNPDLFQKRFRSTWNLCLKISTECGDPDLIRNNLFQNHIRRYNLPVYFEIRFQQIAGNFEKYMLLKPDSELYAHSDKSFKLQTSSALFHSIGICFGPDVFLEQLSDQFLKLSLLLLSRYLKWFDSVLMEEKRYNDRSGNWELFIINSLIDLESLRHCIGIQSNDVAVIDNTVYSSIPYMFKPYVLKIFDNNNKVLKNKSTKLRQYLEHLKIRESLNNLLNVNVIPRLYRRTNKSVPKEASSYVIEAVKSIVMFHSRFKPLVGINFEPIIDTVISKITKEYLELVQQVLNSVFKTEESLRRLKSRTLGTNEDISQSADTVSDEMKIREQIKLDVMCFIGELYPLGGKKSKKMLDLLKSKTAC